MTTILVFSAQWCSECDPYKQMLRQNGIEITEIDIENDTEIAMQYGIKSLPTTIILQGSEIIARFNHVANVWDIINILNGSV